MKRKVFIYGLLGFLLGIAGFAAEEEIYDIEEIQILEEEKIPLTKVEKAEQELAHMQYATSSLIPSISNSSTQPRTDSIR